MGNSHFIYRYSFPPLPQHFHFQSRNWQFWRGATNVCLWEQFYSNVPDETNGANFIGQYFQFQNWVPSLCVFISTASHTSSCHLLRASLTLLIWLLRCSQKTRGIPCEDVVIRDAGHWSWAGLVTMVTMSAQDLTQASSDHGARESMPRIST